MKKAIDELKRLRSILSGITGLEDDDQEYIEDARKSVDRIIEALAEQPAQQQEPISKLFGTLPVYDKPTQASKPWVGLTDDEILYCVELENPKAIAEEVEAKLKENT